MKEGSGMLVNCHIYQFLKKLLKNTIILLLAAITAQNVMCDEIFYGIKLIIVSNY